MKYISILLMLIISINITAQSLPPNVDKETLGSTDIVEKENKCRRIGTSKLNPKKSKRKYNHNIKRDIKKYKIEIDKASKRRRNKIRIPRYRQEEY